MYAFHGMNTVYLFRSETVQCTNETTTNHLSTENIESHAHYRIMIICYILYAEKEKFLIIFFEITKLIRENIHTFTQAEQVESSLLTYHQRVLFRIRSIRIFE